MPELQVQISESAQAAVVALRGDAGAVNVAQLERELQQLSTRKPKLWVFDLSGLTFISSVGLVSLMAFQRNMKRMGIETRLAAVPKTILDILQAAKLAHAFTIQPTVEAAIRGAE
jgi:anti-anti-sigma factor